MKFYSNNIDQIIQKIKAGQITSVLLYGPDSGMASSLIKKIAVAINAKISSAEDGSSLVSSLRTMNMFGDRHVIRAETSIKLDNEIKEILTLKSQNFPIFIGGELSPSSAHRKFYEAGENLASIGCYPDDARAIRQIIIQKASSANLKISSDAIAFLVNTLQGDRLLINNELDKLFLYKDGAQSIELEDCIQSVSESMESNPDLLCIGYGSRNAKLYLKELDNLLENGINEIWILRALARYYLNLLKVKLLLKDGMPLENAMRELKPPIFFKYVDSFKDIVSRLMLDEIKSSLESFTKAEIDFKSGSGSAVLDRVFLHRFG